MARKIKGGLKNKGLRNAPYERQAEMENMNESAKMAPCHADGPGKKISKGHVELDQASASKAPMAKDK